MAKGVMRSQYGMDAVCVNVPMLLQLIWLEYELVIQNKGGYYVFFMSFAIEIYLKSRLWPDPSLCLSDQCLLIPQFSPFHLVNWEWTSAATAPSPKVTKNLEASLILGEEPILLRHCSPCVGGTASPPLLICLPLPLHESDLQNTMPSESLGTPLGPCSSMKLIMEIS